jgi:hypothetical protein
MRSNFLNFFSRFRRKQSDDPMAPRTLADSELQDMQDQAENTEERRVFDEKSFEKGQEALHNGFGSSSHSGDNPIRENGLKNQH